jgi:amino acid adenylation domain-containing protein
MKFTKEDIKKAFKTTPFEESLLVLQAEGNQSNYIEYGLLKLTNQQLGETEIKNWIDRIERFQDCYIYESQQPLRLRLRTPFYPIEMETQTSIQTLDDFFNYYSQKELEFNVQKPPLFHVYVIHNEKDTFLGLAYHHLLFDGISIQLAFNLLDSTKVLSTEDWTPKIQKDNAHIPVELAPFQLESILPPAATDEKGYWREKIFHTTLNYEDLMLLWVSFIQQASGKDKIVIGEVFSARNNETKSATSLGYYIQTWPLDFSGKVTKEILRKVRTQRIEKSSEPVNQHYTPNSFDHCWVVEPEIATEISSEFYSTPHYCLTIRFKQSATQLETELCWNLEKINLQAAKEISSSFKNFIANSDAPSTPKAPTFTPSNTTLIDQWNELCFKNPSKICVEDANGSTYTYNDLEQLANQLANQLIIAPKQCVGVHTSYTAVIIVAYLAILKKGGIYVPLDPTVSEERMNYILKDAKITVVVSDLPPKFSVETVVPSMKLNPSLDHTPPITRSEAKDTCYLIYTSGTTGAPKGCAVNHYNLINLFQGTQTLFQFSKEDRWILAHSYGFDFSTWEIWGALLNENYLYIPDRSDVQDTFKFHELLVSKNITVLNQTPKSFYNLMLVDDSGTALNNIRYVLFGGDKLYSKNVESWCKKYPKTQLVNMYGITETTVHVTYKPITFEAHSNIGIALPGYELSVRNKENNEIPNGFVGEFYVAGNGVCNGYYLQPEVTSEKFIENGTIYKSGDLGWKINNEFYYLGRRDRQVKIRGYRVELGEIEFLLKNKLPLNEFLTLITKEEKLICFFKGANKSIEPEFFRNYLPDYAIPTTFIWVDAFPLNQSGKIDEKKLLLHAENQLSGNQNLNQTETKTQNTLVIFMELLGNHVNPQKSFIQNGGDSISAIRVINKLKQHQLTLTVKDLFVPTPLEQLRVSELETRIKEENSLTTFQKSIQNNDPSLLYVPLIEAQTGILFDCLKSENNSLYVEQLSYEIPSTYTFDEIKNAYTEVAKNNPILKSTLARYNNHYYLKISNETHIECTQYRNESFEKIKALDDQKGLDLEKNLSRLTVIINENCTNIIWTHHHLILDGWSLNVFSKQMTDALNKKGLTYSDSFLRFCVTQHSIQSESRYWSKFSDKSTVSALIPPLPERNNSVSYEKHSLKIPLQVKSQLQNLNISEHAFTFAAWSAFLALLFEKEESIIGNVVSLREDDEFEALGMYIKTLPFYTKFDKDENFETYARLIFNQLIEDQSHKFEPTTPYIKGNQLSHLFVFENYPIDHDVLAKEQIKILDFKEMTSAGWTTIVYPAEDGFEFSILFDTKSFAKNYVKTLLNHFKSWVTNLDWEQPFTISLKQLPREEKQGKDLYQRKFTNTLQLLKKSSQFAAIEKEDGSISYEQLWEKAEKIANELKKLGLQKNEAVGIDVTTTTDFTTALLAIWTVEGVVCSVDKRYPEKRKEIIYKNAQLRYVISTKNGEITIESRENNPKIYLDNASFILHTSGSTGHPKGVLQTHDCLINLIEWNKSHFNLSENERILQLSSFGFDASFHEILLALSLGATLIELPLESRLDIYEIKKSILTHNITLAWIPARLLNAVLDVSEDFFNECHSLSKIVTTGEALILGAPLKKLVQQKKLQLLNYYGPTETHVVTFQVVNHTTIETQPTIGKTVPNCEILLLDENQHEVVQGLPGEIYIAGPHLAHEYINDSKQTNEKFIQISTKKYYKTGDWAYLDSDSNFHFIGRKDDQVKIRGFRIEPLEIERLITDIDSVNQCCVMVIDEKIVAFIVSTASLETIKSQCGEYLPDYMLPATWVTLEEIPFNNNGKADRTILRSIYETQIEENNAIENITISSEIWKETLGHNHFNSNSTFESIGGNSILLMRMQAILEKKQGIFVSIKELIQHNTPQLLNEFILSKTQIKPSNFPRTFVLNSVQKNILLSELGSDHVQKSPFILEFTLFLHQEITFEFWKEKIQLLIEQFPHIVYTLPNFNTPESAVWEYQPYSDLLFEPLSNPIKFAEPLIRFNYVNNKKIRFEWHHILLDGLGMNVLLNTLIAIFENTYSKKNIPIEPFIHPYFSDTNIKIKPMIKTASVNTIILKETELQPLYNFCRENESSISNVLYLSVALTHQLSNIAHADIKNHPGVPGMFTELTSMTFNIHDTNKKTALNPTENKTEAESEVVVNFMETSHNVDWVEKIISTQPSMTKYKYEWQFIKTSDELEVSFYYNEQDTDGKTLLTNWKSKLMELCSNAEMSVEPTSNDDLFDDFDF